MIDQGELFDIPSPCRRICELNNRGYCKGCFRSRDERLYWNQFSPFQKQLVVNLCEKRRLKVLAAKAADVHPLIGDSDVAAIQPDLFMQTPEPVTTPPAVTTPAASPSRAETPSQPAPPAPGGQFDLF